MKTKALILTFLFTSILALGQVTNTVIATYKNAGAWGEWSGLIFLNNDKSELRFINKNNTNKEIMEFWSISSTGTDPEDETAELHTVNSHAGTKYKLVYTTKNIKYKGYDVNGGHEEKENVIISFEPAEADEYKNATCKIYQDGVLKAIAENGKLYEINKAEKKWNEKTIQNKNELCRGSECARAVIDKDGVISTYQLPNITDKLIRGKIVGNQILKYQIDPKGVGSYKNKNIVFTGDKTQAVLAVLIYAWFQ